VGVERSGAHAQPQRERERFEVVGLAQADALDLPFAGEHLLRQRRARKPSSRSDSHARRPASEAPTTTT